MGNIIGMGMSMGQLKQEIVQKEIQKELDRRCGNCGQLINCQQDYNKQQECWKERYGHYLEIPQ